MRNPQFAQVKFCKEPCNHPCRYRHLQRIASMGDQDDLKELPKAPHNLAGESIDRDKAGQYQIKVSNASGYLCHIHVEVLFPFLLCCNSQY